MSMDLVVDLSQQHIIKLRLLLSTSCRARAHTGSMSCRLLEASGTDITSLQRWLFRDQFEFK